MKPLFYLLSLKISGIKNIEVPIELNFYKKTINNSDFDPEKCMRISKKRSTFIS